MAVDFVSTVAAGQLVADAPLDDGRAPLPIGASQLGAAELRAVETVLRNRTLSRHQGRFVSEFESRFARWVGTEAALAVNSGSSALLLAFHALDLEPGAAVLVPTIGFVSGVTAILAAGFVPTFVPVDDSLCIDFEAARRLVDPATGAVLAVHPYGSGCDMGGVMSLAAVFGGAVVEDVAQACGATFRSRSLGTFGDVATFSFQHFKLLSTGEGGMVVSRRPELLDRCRFMHDCAVPWVAPDVAAQVPALRLPPQNLRMPEIEGAIGLAQLDRCDATIHRLREIKASIEDVLASLEGVRLRPHADPAGEIATSVIFWVDNANDAAQLANALRGEGARVSPFFDNEGGNRHWAGSWVPVLERCGSPLPDPDVLEEDVKRLSPALVLYLDVEHTDADVERTVLALEKVCS